MNDFMKEKITSKIHNMQASTNVFETGRIIRIYKYVVEIKGLMNAGYFEEVQIGNKAKGYINVIKEDSVIVSLVKIEKDIYVGDEATLTGRKFEATFSEDSIGHIVDMFGKDQMNAQYFANYKSQPIEHNAISIMSRNSVNRPLYTGISGIDLLYPIGKGQRQLILGDKKTGKTQIALDTICNQKSKDVLCIYISIGKTKKSVKDIYQQLMYQRAMEHTIILCANNDEQPPVMSLTPYVGLSIAEDYMMQGKDVLVVIDDLKRHADVYREIALLTGKEPGRDAYPSDIFYTHSRLLEKGCQHVGGGSITILPIMETRGGDITEYISTNIISITDGQIVLSKKNFDKGQKPAIDYGLSVSRLGGSVQEKQVKKIGSKTRRELLSYLETRDIYELANIDEMGEALQTKLRRGQKLLEAFKQYKYSAKDVEEMVQIFSAFME
ncbi:MAG: F0F1 ATP synthase subunit alpha [Coprobacillus sp.]